MSDTKDIIIYDDTSLADLLKEVHDQTKSKRKQINDMLGVLAPLVQNTSDASILGPIISNFLDISVKNDEVLIKVSQVVQRMVSSMSKNNEDGMLLSDAEKEELYNTVENIRNANTPEDIVPAEAKAMRYLDSGEND